MSQIEKRYDEHGKLRWAKGMARDIYRDPAVTDSCGTAFRIAGEHRNYPRMLPQHLAEMFIGEQRDQSLRRNGDELRRVLPPFSNWQFVLVDAPQADGQDCLLGREISGETVIEVDIEDARQN